MIDGFMKERKESMNLDKLRPWDLSVDEKGRDALQPFDGGDDLLSKTINCFTKLDPYFGQCLETMREMKHLDLVSEQP